MGAGYHNRLAENLGRRRQSLWVFIRMLKDEERFVRRAARRVDLGHPPPARKRKYRKLERRIQSLKEQYTVGQKTISEYLSAVTHVIANFI